MIKKNNRIKKWNNNYKKINFKIKRKINKRLNNIKIIINLNKIIRIQIYKRRIYYKLINQKNKINSQKKSMKIKISLILIIKIKIKFKLIMIYIKSQFQKIINKLNKKI